MENIDRPQTTGKYSKNKKVMHLKSPLYKLLDMIGQGTFGRVYTAMSSKGSVVAVKCVENDEKYKTREIDILRMMNDQHIVKMLDCYSVQKADVTTYVMVENSDAYRNGTYAR